MTGKIDEIPIYMKAAGTILVIVGVCFAFIVINQSQPFLLGDDMSVWFEHEYSDLRENETPLYQNVQLDGSVIVLQLKNLSLTRNYLLVQLDTDYLVDRIDEKKFAVFWIEFNETESEFFWFNHNNKDFYLCAWFERDFSLTEGWNWIIRFSVIND